MNTKMSFGERELIDLWIQNISRSLNQLNAPFESDAEVATPAGPNDMPPAMTIDTVSGETE